ncbi:coilin isoform X2 [Ambystoma mexicanum]|uniref:coilin isoform X2 n=1 Tax=Ambystoma mexicanum TaxID=8296 RepID=UPI0037E74D83
MSVPGVGSLRLRLFFDYPPPHTPESCQCWLLLDLSRCRVVTDLGSLIRSRFGFSAQTRLSLFLDECLLPPCESIGVVRDNDCIRVKLEEVCNPEDVHEAEDEVPYSSKKASKRSRHNYENEEEPHPKKKKKKPKFETSMPNLLHLENGKLQKKTKKSSTKPDRHLDSSSEDRDISVGQTTKLKKKRKKRLKETELENQNTEVKNVPIAKGKKALEASMCLEKSSTSKKVAMETIKESKRASESDSSSSSDKDSKTKQPTSRSSVAIKKKVEPNQSAGSTTTGNVTNDLVASTKGLDITPAVSKTVDPSSSSTDSDKSNKDVAKGTLGKICTEITNPSTVEKMPLQPQKKNGSESSESSDSSDSDSFVIKKSNVGPLTSGEQVFVGNGIKQTTPVLCGPSPNARGAGRGIARGCGRGEDAFFWRGHRGRGFRGRVKGRGRGDANHVHFDYSNDNLKQQQLNHSVTNRSIVIQNPLQATKDYSALPLLAAAPQVGQKIAFKEGKIISYNPSTQQLDLEILTASPVMKVPGKFDLVYENAGGAHTIEYAVSQDTTITQSWTSLIEPRLIVETLSVGTDQVSSENGQLLQ